MEAHIEALTRQNTELLLRIMGQRHPEMIRDEHEEEEHNSQVNGQGYREEDYRKDDCHEDNF
jgi:hypothetical protein